MGQPKSKRTAMLDPRHRAKLLKEKYRQQLAERREPESDSAEIQAVDEVEDTANWAVDTVQDRAAQVPRAREKPPIKEKSAASIPRERKANEQTAASREPPARYTVPKNKNFLETLSAEEARPLDEKQQFEARRQFVADKQKSKLLSEQRIVHSVEEPPAFCDAEWGPVSPSKPDTPKHGTFKEKKRFAVNDHSRSKPEKPLPAPKVKRTSFKTAAKPISAAQKTASQQQIHQTAAQAKKTAKTTVELFKRAAGMLRRAAHGQRCFVAVGEGMLHAQHRGHVDVDMPDAAEAVLHLLAFRFQRRFVGHMTPRAAAAAGVCRAIRRFPGGRRRQRLSLHTPERESGLHLDDAHPRRLAGQHPRHKNGHAVGAAYAFQVRPKAIRRQGQQIVLLHPLRPLPVLASIITGSPDFDKARRGFRLFGGDEGAMKTDEVCGRPPPPFRNARNVRKFF